MRTAIPMIDLAAQHAEIEEELLQGFAEVMASGRFILGEPVTAFETELAKLCEIRHALSCNSGTDALWLAMKALGIGPGDAVLCPAFSFFATAAAVVRAGATPVFTDIDPVTLNLDPEDAIRRAEALPNVRAVLTVDLFGRIAHLGPLEDWCLQHDVPIIEDAAQSIGAVDPDGRPVGARASLACFSFYPTKNLGALGDAGALVTNDASLAGRVASLRVHGETEPGVYTSLGLNSRMDALQAVALSIKLRHLVRWTRARRQRALHYDALFAERGATPASVPMGEGPLPLQTPAPLLEPGRHTYHRYVIRVEAARRAELVAALAEEGIATEVYYARGLHEQPALAEFAPTSPLVETERAANEVLALPLYPELPVESIERVVGVTTRVLSG
ncbi:MAG: DegT/DnrJ/EryC1/StrS family aminotransferase [bacterium]|nr:DegT/DnrJ/EryC1/StrS family aminotransferase [bacterium]